MRVEGSTVLVTGASAGIGAALAEEAGRRGAGRVALFARRPDRLKEVAVRVRATGAEPLVVPVDVSDHEAVARATAEVREAFGVPDVIINNAGAGSWLFLQDTSSEEFIRANAVPYLAAFFVTRAFVVDMMDRGSGSIVSVNSPFSRYPWRGAAAYSASRWALRGLTEVLRSEVRGTGVHVMEMLATSVTTEYFNENTGADQLPGIARLYPKTTPENFARVGFDGIERDKREVHAPLFWRVSNAFSTIAPWSTKALLAATAKKRPTG